MDFILTDHFKRTMVAKGFTPQQVIACLKTPDKITDVRRYPGQVRYCGSGVAIVVDTKTLHVITIYVDGIVTPMREDQRNDPATINSRRLAS